VTRINIAKKTSETRNSETRSSVSWGRAIRNNAGPLVFAAVLIVCSLAVGCSSEKPQPITTNNPAPITPQPSNAIAANINPAPLPEAKPAAKKVVHKRPAVLTFTDKTYGVSFAYPRKYALETGDAATALLMASPVPMNFVQPGGVALAAVELPDSVYADTDLSYAFFTVSVNKALTADQCQEFSVPQTTVSQNTAKSEPAPAAATTGQAASNAAPKADSSDAVKSATLDPKLILGDLEMHGAEAIAGEGTRQADSKYFHVFQNGACYEFALNLTTNGQATDGTMKHVDRDKVFARLETILSTVKIEPDKTEVVKTDAVKTDAAKVDAESSNDKKAEATAGSAANAETAKPDAVTPDASKTDTTKAEAPAPVASAAPNTPPASSIPPQ
jgi:hypothetical protein